MRILSHFSPKGLFRLYSQSDGRSKSAYKNIALSLLTKCSNVICSLLIIPLTINYVNPTQYGIWLTLSGIIGWIHFFDFGLGNGFRNKYAEAKANGDIALARQYLSTTYFSISIIVALVFILALVTNSLIDWSSVLNVGSEYKEELRKVFAIVCFFVCLNMVANIFSTLLTADQKPGIASLIGGVGQILSLLAIFVLTKVSYGSLSNLALYFSGIPCITMLVASLLFFNIGSYKTERPRIQDIRPNLIKNILSIGFQFFLIYICLILVFQLINVVLTRECGAIAVTQYNVAYKYFNMIYMIEAIIISPYWSAFTDAYTKRDFPWMISTIKRLEKVWSLGLVIGLIMLVLSPPFYHLWIGESVTVPFVMSVSMLIFVQFQSLGNIYMFLINGIGTIRIQLYIYIVFAVLSWPALVFSAQRWGPSAITIFPAIVYMIQAIFGRIQLNKIMKGDASGIWMK